MRSGWALFRWALIISYRYVFIRFLTPPPRRNVRLCALGVFEILYIVKILPNRNITYLYYYISGSIDDFRVPILYMLTFGYYNLLYTWEFDVCKIWPFQACQWNFPISIQPPVYYTFYRVCTICKRMHILKYDTLWYIFVHRKYLHNYKIKTIYTYEIFAI